MSKMHEPQAASTVLLPASVGPATAGFAAVVVGFAISLGAGGCVAGGVLGAAAGEAADGAAACFEGCSAFFSHPINTRHITIVTVRHRTAFMDTLLSTR
jgi:hypothetical protein